jgi:hypothetical protein
VTARFQTRAPRGQHLQIFVWDAPGSAGLEPAIQEQMRRLRASFPELGRCRVSVEDVRGLRGEPMARARLKLADTIVTPGWRMVVEARDPSAHGAVRAAFTVARQVLSAPRRGSYKAPPRNASVEFLAADGF